MKKKFMIAVALVLLAVLSSSISTVLKSTLASADYLAITSTLSSTNVSGRISANTTWTSPSSPYIVEADVIVETDVFLTIEPGVTVKFASGTSLIIDGALIAKGNNTHQITFTSNSTSPMRGDWQTIRFRATSNDNASIIDWAIIEYANSGITLYDSGPRIDNSILRFNYRGFYSESNGIARIANSEFLNNVYGIEGYFAYSYSYPSGPRSVISNSRISENTYGVNVGSSGSLMIQQSTISNNTYGVTSNSYQTTEIWESTISKNTVGVYGSSGPFKILGSSISDNVYGVATSSAVILKSIVSNNTGSGVSPYFYKYGDTTYYYDGAFTITYSTITGNKENGIVSRGYGTNTVRFSNIHSNTPYDITNLASYERNADVNATDNWWGTTNTAEMDAHIYDYYDDYNLRRVLYESFLESAVTIPPVAHDLAVVKVTVSPTTVEKWQSVYINVYVLNQGDFDENVTVTAMYDSVQIGKWTPMYGLLGAGANGLATFWWYPSNVIPGNHTISAEINVVRGETDTEDNLYVYGNITVIGPPPIHDIAVTYVTVSPTTVQPGESVSISANIQNQGDFYEAFNVTAYYSGNIIESKNNIQLGPGNFTTLNFSWNTSTVDGGGYQIVIVASVVPGETETSDNTYYDGGVTVTGPQPPHAEFYFSPDRPNVGDSVYFYAYSSYDPDGYIVSYTWDFGDGTTLTATSPYWNHVYFDYYTFTVTLIVTDNANQTSMTTRTIRVNAPPVPAFNWAPGEIRANETVTFESLSYDPDGQIVEYRWDFGDGTGPAYGSAAQHVYTYTGSYSVSLYVIDNDGRGEAFSQQVTVLPKLMMSITPNEGVVRTMISITGANATPMGTVEIYWTSYIFENNSYHLNYTHIGTAAADANGEFSLSFEVNPSTLGSHPVRAVDSASGNYNEKTFRVLPNLNINPITGPIGTTITLSGTGFPYSGIPGFGYLLFDDQLLGFPTSDQYGNMQALINVPLASPGLHSIKAVLAPSYPYTDSQQSFIIEKTFTVIDTTPLDVTVDVGAFYFKGETAECYIQIAFKGALVEATSITAKLNKPDGTTETLTPQGITTGLYKIRYTINGKGSMTGTYSLAVEANYTTETISAHGATIKTFVVKPTWEKEAPKIAAFSIASIGLVCIMMVVWRKEKKHL